MAWICLVLSAVLEPVWAAALASSDGFSKPIPVVVFIIAMVVGTVLLARAAREIPMSTAYGAWTGLGAVLTVGWAMVSGYEPVTVLRVFFLALIVVSVVGLKLLQPQAISNDA